MPSLAELAQRCEGAHRDGQGWRACCPVHQGDNSTMLHLWEKDGEIKVQCYKGCDYRDILAWLDVSRAPRRTDVYEALYSYHDAAGHLVFQVVRRPRKKFFQRRPDPTRPGEWIENMDGVTRVLYRLPEVLAAIAAHHLVYLVEGEKDVETLRSHGLTATCNAMGAKKWQDDYTLSLLGADVLLLPDNDAEGRAHADLVTAKLAGSVHSFRRLDLPGLPEKGDVTDWLQAGHTIEALQALTPPLQAAMPPRYHKVLHLEDVEEAPIDWLWWPYLAKGTLNILDGDPGIGKSLFTLYLGALLSRGHPLPDQLGQPTLPTGGPQTTLVFSLEDSVSRTIKRRVREAGADERYIRVVTVRVEGQDEHMIQLKTELDLLAADIHTYRPALVIFDPLHAYLGDLDLHRANETRPLLNQLVALAEATQTTLLGIRHPAKPGQQVGKAIHRGLGSIDIGASMRCGLYIEQHPADPDRLLLCHYKTNLGPYGRTQIFSKKEGRFAWAGVSRLTAEAIAGQGRGKHPQAFLEACFWLEALFTRQASYQSTEIRDKADEDEIGWTTLRAAKKALGVSSQRLGKDSWLWSLPPLDPFPPPSSHTMLATTASTSTTASTATTASTQFKGVTGFVGEDAQDAEDAVHAEDAVVAAVVYEDLPPPGRTHFARPARDTRERKDLNG